MLVEVVITDLTLVKHHLCGLGNIDSGFSQSTTVKPVIHSRSGTMFRHALIDVRLNHQCQFSGYLPARKELRFVALKHTLRQALFVGRQQKVCHLHVPPGWTYRKLISKAMLLCAAISNSCMSKKHFMVAMFQCHYRWRLSGRRSSN